MTPEQAALAEALAARIIGSNKALRILPYYIGQVLFLPVVFKMALTSSEAFWITCSSA